MNYSKKEVKYQLLTIGLALIGILFFWWQDWHDPWTVFLLLSVVNLLSYLGLTMRRKKQLKRIQKIIEKKQLSVEEFRHQYGVSRYDLPNWQFKDSLLTPRKLDEIEAQLLEHTTN